MEIYKRPTGEHYKRLLRSLMWCLLRQGKQSPLPSQRTTECCHWWRIHQGWRLRTEQLCSMERFPRTWKWTTHMKQRHPWGGQTGSLSCVWIHGLQGCETTVETKWVVPHIIIMTCRLRCKSGKCEHYCSPKHSRLHFGNFQSRMEDNLSSNAGIFGWMVRISEI